MQLFHNELAAWQDAARGLANGLYVRVVDKVYGLLQPAGRGSGEGGAGGGPPVMGSVLRSADSVAKALGQEWEDAARRLAGACPYCAGEGTRVRWHAHPAC